MAKHTEESNASKAPAACLECGSNHVWVWLEDVLASLNGPEVPIRVFCGKCSGLWPK